MLKKISKVLLLCAVIFGFLGLTLIASALSASDGRSLGLTYSLANDFIYASIVFFALATVASIGALVCKLVYWYQKNISKKTISI